MDVFRSECGEEEMWRRQPRMTNDSDRPEVAVCGLMVNEWDQTLLSRVEKESRFFKYVIVFSPVKIYFCQCNRLLVGRSVCLFAKMCVHECVTG